MSDRISKAIDEQRRFNEALEKAEGSRGGKVIGHTKTFKPIYEHADHPTHRQFSARDHSEAIALHQQKFDHATTPERKRSDDEYPARNRPFEKMAAHHAKQIAAHTQAEGEWLRRRPRKPSVE